MITFLVKPRLRNHSQQIRPTNHPERKHHRVSGNCSNYRVLSIQRSRTLFPLLRPGEGLLIFISRGGGLLDVPHQRFNIYKITDVLRTL